MKHSDDCLIHSPSGSCSCIEPEPPAEPRLVRQVIDSVTLIGAQSRASQVEEITRLLAKAPQGGESVIVLYHWTEVTA